MKSGQRLADGDPTVPMMTVSTARTGETDSSATITKPRAARPSVVNICMIILHVHSIRRNSMTDAHGTVGVIHSSGYCSSRGFFLRGCIALQLRAIVPRNFRARSLPDLL